MTEEFNEIEINELSRIANNEVSKEAIKKLFGISINTRKFVKDRADTITNDTELGGILRAHREAMRIVEDGLKLLDTYKMVEPLKDKINKAR